MDSDHSILFSNYSVLYNINCLVNLLWYAISSRQTFVAILATLNCLQAIHHRTMLNRMSVTAFKQIIDI